MRDRQFRVPTRRGSRSLAGDISLRGPVLLLGLALILAAILAVQGIAAARARHRVAEDTLREASAGATTAVTTRLAAALPGALQFAFLEPLVAVRSQGSVRDRVDAFAKALLADTTAHRLTTGARYAFHVDLRTGAVVARPTEPSAEVRTWLVDTITARARRLSPERRTTTLLLRYGRGGDGAFVVMSSASFGVVFDQRAGTDRAIAYALVYDSTGLPLGAFGFESSPAALITPLAQQTADEPLVLPSALLRGIATDSVFSLTVSVQHGDVLYRSPARFQERFASLDTLPETAGGLVVRGALRADAAARLVAGGLPPSGLPLLLSVFALTMGVIIIALVQLQRAEELARLRSGFIAGVSHELRTPLTQIRLLAEMLVDRDVRTEEERARSIAIIHEESERLSALVETVLTFERLERGRLRPKVAPLSLRDTLQTVLDAFAPLARSRGSNVELRIEGAPIVRADAYALRQSLFALLENALKFGPAGQVITVGAAAHAGHVRIWVDDEGPGIPPSERRRVWQPYARLDRDVAGTTGGTGIGLAVVRRLTRMQHGRCWAEATPTGGARIVIELPLQLAPAED